MSAEDKALIQDYLYKRMSVDMQRTFEARLANEPALAEELAIERAIYFAGVELLMTEVEQDIAEIRAEHKQVLQTPTLRVIQSRPGLRWIIGLAAALVLALTFWFLQSEPASLSQQELALEYLPRLGRQNSFRSPDPLETPGDSIVQAFNLAFNQRDPVKCKSLLPRFRLKNAQDSLDVQVKWAWVDLMEGKMTTAETQFDFIKKDTKTQGLPQAIRENLDYGLFLSRFLQGKTDQDLQNRLQNSLVYAGLMRKLAAEKRLDLSND